MATKKPSSSGGAGAGAASKRSSVKVDPKVLAALRSTSDNQPVRVMVKLKSGELSYGKLPASNAPGNPRLVEFTREVNDVVKNASNAAAATTRIVSSAANIGVATLDAPKTVLQKLMRESRLQGMKFVKIV